MAAERQQDLGSDSKELSPVWSSDGGQRQVAHDEPFMEIDGKSWDDPALFAGSSFIFTPEKPAGASKSDKGDAAASKDEVEQDLSQDLTQTLG
eukprot:397395-Rhodomonas_salina.1